MRYTKRPAVLLSFTYLLALGISHWLSAQGISLWLLALFAAVFFFVYIVCFDGKRHLLLCTVIAFAIAFAGLQMHGVAKERALWEDLRGTTVSVCGTVDKVTYISDGISYMTATITELDGRRISSGVSLSVEGGAVLSAFDTFSGTATVLTREESSGYLEENGNYCRANGIVCELALHAEDLVRCESPFSLRGTFADLRTRLCALLARYVDYDTLSFLSGLVLGDRDAISETVARDFRRTGTSHMLAVSGTHLSVMIAALGLLCKRLRVRRSVSIILLLVSAGMIVGITGFSLSVLRAALMWGIGSLAYVFGGKRDVYSALALAPAILCAWDVYAMYDIGLQMSVLCTLGILVLGVPTDKWLAAHLPRRRACVYLRAVVLIPLALTVSATVFTLPIALFSYGEISLMAPLANLLLTPPATFLLLATPILLLLGCLPVQLPARLLGLLISAVTKLTLQIAACLSSLPNSLLGIRYIFTPFVLFAAFLLAYLLYRRRRSVLVLYGAFLFGAVLFLSCHGIYHALYRDRVTVIYRAQNENESIGILSDGGAVLIDISNGANGANYRAWQALCDRQVTELDALVLTHYDRKHDAMLAYLCKRAVVRTIYMPKPTSAKDMEIYSAIRGAASLYNSTCIEYDPSEDGLQLGEICITVSETAYLSRSEVPLTVLSVEIGAQRLSYISSAAWESTEEDVRAALQQTLSDTQYLICGGHSPKIKTPYGMRKEQIPYRTVCVPSRADAALFAHTAETLVLTEDTESMIFDLWLHCVDEE